MRREADQQEEKSMIIKEGEQSKAAHDKEQIVVSMKGVLYGEGKAVTGEDRGLQAESGEDGGRE